MKKLLFIAATFLVACSSDTKEEPKPLCMDCTCFQLDDIGVLEVDKTSATTSFDISFTPIADSKKNYQIYVYQDTVFFYKKLLGTTFDYTKKATYKVNVYTSSVASYKVIKIRLEADGCTPIDKNIQVFVKP